MTRKDAHMSLSDRQIIETGIANGSSKKSIADTIGKDKSTVTREIRNHRILKKYCAYPIDCVLFPNARIKTHSYATSSVRTMFRFIVHAAIVPLVPVMAVPSTRVATTTSTGMTPLRLSTNTKMILFSAESV